MKIKQVMIVSSEEYLLEVDRDKQLEKLEYNACIVLETLKNIFVVDNENVFTVTIWYLEYDN